MNITHDPDKNKVNRKKHQIDLTEVEGVFYDGRAITVEDRDHAEERFVTLGNGWRRPFAGGGLSLSRRG